MITYFIIAFTCGWCLYWFLYNSTVSSDYIAFEGGADIFPKAIRRATLVEKVSSNKVELVVSQANSNGLSKSHTRSQSSPIETIRKCHSEILHNCPSHASLDLSRQSASSSRLAHPPPLPPQRPAVSSPPTSYSTSPPPPALLPPPPPPPPPPSRPSVNSSAASPASSCVSSTYSSSNASSCSSSSLLGTQTLPSATDNELQLQTKSSGNSSSGSSHYSSGGSSCGSSTSPPNGRILHQNIVSSQAANYIHHQHHHHHHHQHSGSGDSGVVVSNSGQEHNRNTEASAAAAAVNLTILDRVQNFGEPFKIVTSTSFSSFSSSSPTSNSMLSPSLITCQRPVPTGTITQPETSPSSTHFIAHEHDHHQMVHNYSQQTVAMVSVNDLPTTTNAASTTSSSFYSSSFSSSSSSSTADFKHSIGSPSSPTGIARTPPPPSSSHRQRQSPLSQQTFENGPQSHLSSSHSTSNALTSCSSSSSSSSSACSSLSSSSESKPISIHQPQHHHHSSNTNNSNNNNSNNNNNNADSSSIGTNNIINGDSNMVLATFQAVDQSVSSSSNSNSNINNNDGADKAPEEDCSKVTYQRGKVLPPWSHRRLWPKSLKGYGHTHSDKLLGCFGKTSVPGMGIPSSRTGSDGFNGSNNNRNNSNNKSGLQQTTTTLITCFSSSGNNSDSSSSNNPNGCKSQATGAYRNGQTVTHELSCSSPLSFTSSSSSSCISLDSLENANNYAPQSSSSASYEHTSSIRSDLITRLTGRIDAWKCMENELATANEANEQHGLRLIGKLGMLGISDQDSEKITIHLEEVEKVTQLLLSLSGRLKSTESDLNRRASSNRRNDSTSHRSGHHLHSYHRHHRNSSGLTFYPHHHQQQQQNHHHIHNNNESNNHHSTLHKSIDDLDKLQSNHSTISNGHSNIDDENDEGSLSSVVSCIASAVPAIAIGEEDEEEDDEKDGNKSIANDHDPEYSLLLIKRSKLLDQLEEAVQLKESIDRRSELLSEKIMFKYFKDSPEDINDFAEYIKMKIKLIVERRQLMDKIEHSQHQLIDLSGTVTK
ncbi:uncharacterized protein LOC141856973 isoform X2 [Brevipalpus obovatus]|uniref:uncharacterized protein LOC141856973 isoform X2 n=1 Tax=Brevipalpus obovatus TaxID=246614 RepID=UPI003D9F403C